jgi:hypothetical protein
MSSRTVPVEHLVEAAKEFGMTFQKLSISLGMAPNFISSCRSTGKAPAWTKLAIEALQRRRGNGTHKVYVLKALPRDAEVIKVLLNKFGVTFTEL